MSAGQAVRAPAIASASLDLLINEYYDYLRRNHDETTLAGREDMLEKMERVGYKIGRRFAERCVQLKSLLETPQDALASPWSLI